MSSLLEARLKPLTRKRPGESLRNDNNLAPLSNTLNSRFSLLRTQLEQFSRQIAENEDERGNDRLVNICQQWLNEIRQLRMFDTIQEETVWLNTSIGKCAEVLESLQRKIAYNTIPTATNYQECPRRDTHLLQTIDEVEIMSNELHIKLTRLTEVELRFQEFLSDVENAISRMKSFRDDLASDQPSSDIQVTFSCCRFILSLNSV